MGDGEWTPDAGRGRTDNRRVPFSGNNPGSLRAVYQGAVPAATRRVSPGRSLTLNSTGSDLSRGLPRGRLRRVAEWAGSAAIVLAGLLGSVIDARGQWVEEPGKGWITLAMYHQDTRERFDPHGDAEKLSFEGHAIATSSFLTLALGIVEGVDIWGQASFHRLRYDDASAERLSTGLGDTRLWLRAAPLKWLGSRLPFAIRAGFKVPVGDFDNLGVDEVPLGDGQRDWEVIAELGHSFWPRSVYVSGWLGHRWREENAQSGRDFGNEVFYYAQIGGQLGRVGYKLAVDGWNGAAAGGAGAPGAGFERDLVQLLPALQYDAGVGQFESGVRFALGGKNVTAGTSFVFRFFTRW
ncbi:MAG: hypothetical protein OXU69_04775 [Gemmatimonadota bacterium]|nr:hypothetical protein [Gemmatimonadota bacterium]